MLEDQTVGDYRYDRHSRIFLEMGSLPGWLCSCSIYLQMVWSQWLCGGLSSMQYIVMWAKSSQLSTGPLGRLPSWFWFWDYFRHVCRHCRLATQRAFWRTGFTICLVYGAIASLWRWHLGQANCMADSPRWAWQPIKSCQIEFDYILMGWPVMCYALSRDNLVKKNWQVTSQAKVRNL